MGPSRSLTTLVACLIGFLIAADLRGQGGPPMITDDPETPGDGHLENNLAVTFERENGQTHFELPNSDLNYGVGEHLQLNLETAVVVLTRNNHGPIAGMGSTEAAVKWRFLDQESDFVSVSIYPRLIWNFAHSSVRRGLADDGTRFQLPVEAAKKFGHLDLDCEIGLLLSSIGRSEWFYGVVGGVALSSTTYLMGEIHGSARTNFDRDTLTLNAGLKQKLTDSTSLITSLGHDVRSPRGQPLALIGYFGVQLQF